MDAGSDDSLSNDDDSTKKRRDILTRRPSYRKILNDLGGGEIAGNITACKWMVTYFCFKRLFGRLSNVCYVFQNQNGLSKPLINFSNLVSRRHTTLIEARFSLSMCKFLWYFCGVTFKIAFSPPFNN